MKGKIFTVLALILTLSSHCFAIQINKGRLLSHNEWSTDNHIKLEFKDNNRSIDTLPKFKSRDVTSNELNSVHAYVRMYEASGNIGSMINLTGYSFLIISNDTTSTHIYEISTRVCTQFDSTSGTACGESDYQISLDPSGFLLLSGKREISYTYMNTGVFPTYIATSVMMDDHKTLFNSFEENTVEILNRKK